MTVLLLERGHDGPHRLDKAGALRAVALKPLFAPEHAWENGPLGGAVRGLYRSMAHTRPQCLAPLEHLPTPPFSLGHSTRLASFQQPFHLAPDWPPIAGKAGMRLRAVEDPRPPMQHLTGLRPPGLSHHLGQPPAPAQGVDVAQQMRPTELAS